MVSSGVMTGIIQLQSDQENGMIAGCMKNQMLKKQTEKISDNRSFLSVVLQVLFFKQFLGQKP